MEAFRQEVIAYCEMDDEIKDLQKQLKDLRKRHTEKGEEILKYMLTESLEVCNAGVLGVLTVHTTRSTQSLNEEYIHECILNHSEKCDMRKGSSEDYAKKMTAYIMENRESMERKKLRRKTK